MAGLDTSRYGAAATAAPVLTVSARPRPVPGLSRRGPGPRWGPFRTGLRCHFGRCWASATGRQHPRRQPRPALKGAGVCGGRLASGPRLSSVETSKVFAQAFFKRLAERETASRDPKGVARTVGPAFPYTKKGGDGRPPLGTAQKPLPQGLRERNARITPKTQETSHFYDLCRCTNHF